jgi:nucleotide-binding universal stress UspA family protein
MFKRILVPTDGSELSERAVMAAIDIAKRMDGTIVGLCVSQPYPFLPFSETSISDDMAEFEYRSRELAEHHVAKIMSAAKVANIPAEVRVTKSFHPYQEIIGVAKASNCDSIVMASHGRKGLNRILLGSETQKVLSHTELPVLVCR